VRNDATADVEPAVILLRGCPKLMYSTMLRVGNQELEAVIDTGSSNLLLMGADCMGCSDTPRYRRLLGLGSKMLRATLTDPLL
jgi:hypothetical protein